MQIEEVTTEDNGRIIGLVEDGSLNAELIRRGLAWVHKQDCDRPVCDSWEKLENRARESEVGLWSSANPTPPW